MKTRSGKLKQIVAIAGISTVSIGAIGSISPVNALTFNFFSSGDTALQDALNGSTTVAQDKINAANGFRAAGNLWSTYLDNNITINIDIGFSNLGSGTLADARSTAYGFSYSNVYNKLNTQKTSADDNAAVSNLSATSSFNRLINYTTENNNGNTYVNSASTISVNSANAKALGLTGFNYTATDATISFNSVGYNWDFSYNPTTIASSGNYDFVGIAAHEIGHALGFVSGVDDFDNGGTTSESKLYTTSTLDLFRYSLRSNTNGNNKVIDMAADNVNKYFSVDGGNTPIAPFSQGAIHGVGADYKWQASHWADNQSLGVMDPTSSPGQYLQITENDVRMMDVIGYKRKSNTPVPEPSTWIGTIIFGAFGIKTILKRRRKLVGIVDRETNDA